LNVYMQVVSSPEGLSHDLRTRECSDRQAGPERSWQIPQRNHATEVAPNLLLTRLCMCTGF
jgi:hypothetical protein